LELRQRLQQAPDLLIIGESECAQEALTQIEALKPEVVVVDCHLPDLSCAEVVQRIQKQGLRVGLLAIGAAETDQEVLAMLQAGARGYMLRHEAVEHIVSGVRAVARGEGWFSPGVAMLMAAWLRQIVPQVPGLTHHQIAVVRLIAQGKSNKEIASALKMKERTVDYHVGNILRKLGSGSRVEAAL
jgi:DNA-binding NarL/FixJ family response regulator